MKTLLLALALAVIAVPALQAEPAPLVDALPRFSIQLSCNGQMVAEGSGKNSLRSPALCLAELASALAADLHACNAFIPALNNLAGAQ